MTLSDYQGLNEGMTSDEVADIFEKWFDETTSEPLEDSLAKLDILADHQWHTYSLAPQQIRDKLEEWLASSVSQQSNQECLEIALGSAYCFGLTKELYMKWLTFYQGEFVGEFKSNLENTDFSLNYVDPYWSLKA